MARIMSEEEYMKVIGAAVRAKPMTEDQMLAIIKWAENTRINQALLEGLLNGNFNITYRAESCKKKDMMITRGPKAPRKNRGM